MITIRELKEKISQETAALKLLKTNGMDCQTLEDNIPILKRRLKTLELEKAGCEIAKFIDKNQSEIYSTLQSIENQTVFSFSINNLNSKFDITFIDNKSYKMQTKNRQRRQRVNLGKLIDNGYLKNNQNLYFFKQEKYNIFAKLVRKSSNKVVLVQDEKEYSMSDLAVKILREQFGHKSSTIRGTEYWSSGNTTILKIWDKYLNNKEE